MKSLVLLSGGMDSTVALYRQIDLKKTVECVSFYYGQRHAKELKCASEVCASLSVPHVILDIENVMKSLTSACCLINASVAVPEGRFDDEVMKSTVVPNRNMILVSMATAVAISRGLDEVVLAAHDGDHAIYPDCRPAFIESMRSALALCDERIIALSTPFIGIDKGGICRLGVSLGVPFEKTWTCYKGEEKPCGRCGSCVERREAFEYAKAVDPLAIP